MKRPVVINQHYIPRSYLKNFGFLVNAKKNKWSVYAMENGGEIERRTTEKICSVDYLYDLPFAPEEERQFLEHAYEAHADRHFKEITAFVIDDSKKELSDAMREKLLKSCLSLYFRTPKFVALDQHALDEIQALPEAEQELAWKIRKNELLEESVRNFEQLYNLKKHCGISVNKSARNWEFISGDNPVIIRNKEGELVDVFSPDNVIHIPLTPKYTITIMPSTEVSLHNTFYRMYFDNDSVMGINHDIEKYHEKYLLGTKKALELYLQESPMYKAPALPTHPKLLKLKGIQKAVEGLVRVVQKNNGQITDEVRAYFSWCWKNVDGFKDDPNAQEQKDLMGIK